MSKLLIINANLLEKILFELGFIKKRQKGSHAFYRHSDGRYTTIPFHGKRDLARPVIRSVLRQIGLDIDSYNRLVQKLK